jgi:hypothetical protein
MSFACSNNVTVIWDELVFKSISTLALALATSIALSLASSL